MRGKSITLGLAALIAVMATGGTALARGWTNPFLVMGAPLAPPRGFTEMCGARPDLCASFGGFAGQAAASRQVVAFRATLPEALVGWPASFRPAPWPDVLAKPVGCPPDGAGTIAAPSRRHDMELAGPAGVVVAEDGWGLGAEPPAAEARGTAVRGDGLQGLRWRDGDGLVVAPIRQERLPFGWQAMIGAARPMVSISLPAGPMAWRGPSADPVAGDSAVMPAPELSEKTPQKMADWRKQLARVNAHVNAHVSQQSDLATYGFPEFWRPSGAGAGAAGDCEDLALEKRVELLASHFPPERLFLAVVYRRDVGLHTVLVARLDGGDVVLDSRVDYLEPWDRAGYDWVSMETPGQPSEWREVA